MWLEVLSSNHSSSCLTADTGALTVTAACLLISTNTLAPGGLSHIVPQLIVCLFLTDLRTKDHILLY